MSHLAWALALSAVFACSGSKPAEPAVPGEELAAPEAAASEEGSGKEPGSEPAATDAQGVVQTLFVASEVVDCEGEAPQTCLLVRDSESKPYRRLYSGIAGFEHEASYEYELKVEATAVPNPPADASSVSYRLIEVVAKRKVVPGRL
jgi:hypothetical protein